MLSRCPIHLTPRAPTPSVSDLGHERWPSTA